jgi:hypothetical protein
MQFAPPVNDGFLLFFSCVSTCCSYDPASVQRCFSGEGLLMVMWPGAFDQWRIIHAVPSLLAHVR